VSVVDIWLEVNTVGVRDIRTWDISKVLGVFSVRHDSIRMQFYCSYQSNLQTKP
jgi:hypothetical protein